MCLDLFCPGKFINIDFLFEQIWFEHDVQGSRGMLRLKITEVYDLLISNPPGNSPVTELWALFPHNCTVVGDDGRRTALVDPHGMGPPVPVIQERYEWPYFAPPVDVQGSDLVARSYASDHAARALQLTERKAKRLIADEVVFPQGFTDDLVDTLVTRLTKTCVCIKLNCRSILPAGEHGWLRLIVSPHDLEERPPKTWIFDNASRKGLQRKRFSVTCPMLLRSRLQALLDAELARGVNAGQIRPFQRLQESLVRDGFNAPGTGTRIGDHRVALVAASDAIDINETSCGNNVQAYGEVPFDDPAVYGMWWGGGSDRNRENDLQHNVERIVNRFRYGRTLDGMNEIARDLAPSGKHEAQSLLLTEMINARLLEYASDDKVRLPDGLVDAASRMQPRPFTVEFHNRLRSLQAKYATPGDVSADKLSLYQEFRDAHPFRIDFRLVFFGEFPDDKKQ